MKTRLKSLDLLKGIGILMIILVHNRHFLITDMTGWRKLINYGQMGCQLFFMVSGMALCYSWENSARKNSHRHFLLRRYLRLAPGYLFIMLINYILNVLLIDVLNLSPGFIMNRNPLGVITNILFLHGFFPEYINSVFPGGWYIGTTFILYALFPGLFALFDRLHATNRRLTAVIPAALLLLNCAALHTIAVWSNGSLAIGNNTFLYFFFTNQLPCFSLGIMLYFQEKENFSLRLSFPVSAILAAITSLASVLLFVHSEWGLVYAVIPSLAGLSFYWIAVCLIHIEKSEISLFKQNGFLSTLLQFVMSCGENSYAMYLVHGFVSWYCLKGLSTFLTSHGYVYSEILLYILVYIPSVIAIYLLGQLMRKMLTLFSGALSKLQRII